MSSDRVRSHSPGEANREIDREAVRRISRYEGADGASLNERISRLEGEWDIERVLEANAATLAFTGVTLGALHHRRWLVLPAAVSAFLLQHAVQGWCPPVAVFRRLGIRTRREIEEERYALKVMRGDFEDVASADGSEDADRIMAAVRRS